MAEPIEGPYKVDNHGHVVLGHGFRFHQYGQGDAEIWAANANLLAASWEMRHAIEVALDAYNVLYTIGLSDIEHGDGDGSENEEVRAYNLMRQALASAKGETT